MTTLLIDVPRELAPDDRLALKAAIGTICRAVLAADHNHAADLPISIDHLGLPITNVDQMET